MKHLLTYLCYACLGYCLMACAPQKELFTQPHRERITSSPRMDVEKVQYYNDRDIRLVYKSKFGNETVSGGKVEFRDGYYIYTIEIKRMTPCVGKTHNANSMKIFFEEGNYLMFRNFGDDPYYQLAGQKRSGTFLVRYENKWFVPEEGGDARLLFVQNRVLERKEEYRQAKGIKVE